MTTRSSTEDDLKGAPEKVLLTGFPAYTARRFARELLARDGEATLFLLARSKFSRDARSFVDELPEDQRARVEIVVGDVCDMDLGLSGQEYNRIAGEITTVQHLAGIYYMGVDRATARRVNVEGTRSVLEFAGDAVRLRRLCHWSTATVAGKRRGMVLEEELEEGQSFHNFYEETKYEAEVLARRAQQHLPVTIFRPGLIVGDSRTGEIDKFDGPYYLMVLLASGAPGLRLPLPHRGTAPMPLVPIDYVIRAGYQLSIDERAAGRTFHLTDPNPLSARRVYDLVAELTEQPGGRSLLPSGVARTLLRAPGLDRLTRAPKALLESLDHQCFYNSRHALALLRDADDEIVCPPFDDYAAVLVQYVREAQSAREHRLDDEVFDPFD